MATFNSQTALAAWKKIEYKNGIVKATFMDGARTLLKIAEGLDTPPTEDVPKTGIKININEYANETN